MKLRKKAGTPAGPHLAFFILNLLLAATLPGVSYGWSWDDKTGDVTLEPGVTRVTNADIPYVAALTGIEIPADASLVFENTQSLTLSASLSGAGEVSSPRLTALVTRGLKIAQDCDQEVDANAIARGV